MNRAENKAERILQIEALLLAHPEGLTQAEIARRLMVNRSTITRDMPGLSPYIYIEDDGKLKIDRQGYLVEVRLNLNEALALHLATRLLATRMDRQNPYAGSALRKLGAALERLAPRISAHMMQSAEVMDDAARRHDPGYLQALERLTLAWAEQHKALVWHRHEESGEVRRYTFAPYFIEPYAVGQSTHAIGWREPPGKLRTFKIERIERVEVLKEGYTIPQDFDPRQVLGEAWGIWYTEGAPVEVRLRFAPGRAARRVRESLWHATQKLEDQADGGLVWSAQVAEWREMLPWVRGWGADCEVLAPEGMREALKSEAQELARLYKIMEPARPEKIFYAHSKPGVDRSGWQFLKDHLVKTSEIAARLGQDAGVGELARAAALLHDIGKYSQAFQERLNGAKHHVDHATAGAREIIELLPQAPLNDFAELLSYCIAGHHSGLPDYGNSTDVPDASTLLARRQKKRLEDYSAYKTEIDPSRLTFEPRQIQPNQEHPWFSISFLTRMVFSTLVDADWLETETYMEGADKPRGGHCSIEELQQRLQQYLKRYDNPIGSVNQKRSETLKACIENSVQPPGFFKMTVPTGGGKTLASMAFALNHAASNGLKRVIYVIPFTSIIEQNAAIFKEALGDENVLEHHSNFDWRLEGESGARDDETNNILNKLKLATENWDIPIVVTTNVQFFESLFASKKSRCRKLHNIAKSVIIFDEAQMLPREYLRPCMLAVGELVQNYGASVVFCTATQPELGQFFSGTKITELAPDPPKLFNFYQRVQVKMVGKLLDQELAERLMAQNQVVCIVNTRRHAKGLFDLLDGEGRFHLSTLMCPVHRKSTLQEIRQILAEGRACRVISTQVIEAGVDLDFPLGYRALSGLDSIIQAAGRVNRERRNSMGDVYVFEPETDFIKRTPTFIQQTASVALSILRDYGDDPISIPAMQSYFNLLDGLQDRQRSYDVQKILACLDKEGFDFKTAAEKFRIIEDGATASVIIPYDKAARDLLESVRFSTFPARFTRQLQLYTVNLYPREYESLQVKGAIETYQDLFSVLTRMEYYDNHTGIVLPADEGGEAIFFD